MSLGIEVRATANVKFRASRWYNKRQASVPTTHYSTLTYTPNPNPNPNPNSNPNPNPDPNSYPATPTPTLT